MNRSRFLSLTSMALGLSGLCSGVFAQAVDYGPILGGTTSHYSWENFAIPAGVSEGTNGTAGQWAGTTAPTNEGFVANNGASAGNLFYVPLTSGVASFPSETTDFTGGAIYSFFSTTHYQVSSTTPLLGAQSIVFQLYLGAGLSGPFGGTPVDLMSAPVLTLTLADSSTMVLPANFSLLESSEETFVPQISLNTTLDLLGYQWDLSSVDQPITSYTIDFQASYHTMIFQADTVESDLAHSGNVLETVPEPSTWTMLGLGGLAALGYRLRAKRAKMSC